MSIFILGNKNLKGKRRNTLVVLYGLHILLFSELLILNGRRIISTETSAYLFLAWLLVVICIWVAEYLFHRSMKNKIKVE